MSHLYLIPNTLGSDGTEIIPPYVKERVNHLTHFIVENERNARRYLIRLGIKTAIDDLSFYVLDKHQPNKDIGLFVSILKKGIEMGLISDAGCPAIADPGSLVVEEAHRQGIQVHPMVGPSSILLALIGSGFNGQQFVFHGYLPIDQRERNAKIKSLESQAKKSGYAQIFMETPYRNGKLFQALIDNCQKNTLLSICTDVTLPSEFVLTKSMQFWKKHPPDIHKRPTVFILGR